jgi:plasmid stabilization system protein ParE
MTRVSFHRLAERELNDAMLYYESESRGLGVRFLDEIERYIEAILKNPNAGKRVRGPVRRRILRKFPYGILYSVKVHEIRILAIMNLKRRPTYWVGRSWNYEYGSYDHHRFLCMRSVDIFQRLDGTFGFEELHFGRAEQAWYPVGKYSYAVVDTLEKAKQEAKNRVSWLAAEEW